MWIFTTFGFFSVVQKPKTDFLTVRARVAEDLDNLRAKYLPELSSTIKHAGTDYPFRATVSHSALSKAMAQIVADVDYSNFKNEVAAKQGSEREDAYHKVWHAVFELQQETNVVAPSPKPKSTRKPLAYGGVVFDGKGHVLLVEPKDHYGGMVWTFPKGRPNNGESPEHAAIREVEEESGVKASIVVEVAGDFEGSTTVTRYFVMRADSHGKCSNDETESICWVDVEEAPLRIAQTKNRKGRERDLDVLKAAIAVVKALNLAKP